MKTFQEISDHMTCHNEYSDVICIKHAVGYFNYACFVTHASCII